jgi:hypothetical protein
MLGDLLNQLIDTIEKCKTAVRDGGQLTDIAVIREMTCNHEDVWTRVKDALAEDRLASIVRSRVKRPALGEAKPPLLPGFEELGRTAAYFEGTFRLAEATADQVHSYRKWYEKRHAGSLVRSEREKVKLQKIIKLDRLLQKYSKTDPKITASSAIERQQALRSRAVKVR